VAASRGGGGSLSGVLVPGMWSIKIMSNEGDGDHLRLGRVMKEWIEKWWNNRKCSVN
jgi:hypothetical protein